MNYGICADYWWFEAKGRFIESDTPFVCVGYFN